MFATSDFNLSASEHLAFAQTMLAAMKVFEQMWVTLDQDACLSLQGSDGLKGFGQSVTD